MIYMYLDQPKKGEIIYDHIIRLSGWAFSDSAPVLKIMIYIDGKYISDAEYGTERQEVYDAFPDIPASYFSQFTYIYIPEFINGYKCSKLNLTIKVITQKEEKTLSIEFKRKQYIFMGKNILRNPFKMIVQKYADYLNIPFGFLKMKSIVDMNRTLNILDVGCGNHSVRRFKKFFNCNYYGVDISRNYNNNDYDIGLMSDFYEMDLTKLEFDSIPNDFFDVVYCSHNIEHLYNGDDVVRNLVNKVKAGGILYLEFPTIKSIFFPTKPGTLNFYDDPTHIRLYPLFELLNILTINGMSIKETNVRRRKAQIFALPFLLLRNKLRGEAPLPGGAYWDLYGFAEYILAQKN